MGPLLGSGYCLPVTIGRVQSLVTSMDGRNVYNAAGRKEPLIAAREASSLTMAQFSPTRGDEPRPRLSSQEWNSTFKTSFQRYMLKSVPEIEYASAWLSLAGRSPPRKLLTGIGEGRRLSHCQ